MIDESGLPLESGGVGRKPAEAMLALDPMLEMRVPCGAWKEPRVGVALVGLPVCGEGESDIVCGYEEPAPIRARCVGRSSNAG